MRSYEGIQFKTYRLRHQIGEGGTSEVYLGDDLHLQRQVAMKIVPLETTEAAEKEARRLFLREMRVLTTLDHPAILPLYDYGEVTMKDTHFLYLVMPYRKDGSLVRWLRTTYAERPLPLHLVVALIKPIAEALAAAHAQGIIHLDVKPANVLVAPSLGRESIPHLNVADFGSARFCHATVTRGQHQQVRGTPAMMAPEHWQGRPEAASDQYALAVMTYELLTGKRPFVGTMEQLLYQHLTVAPLPPSHLCAAISDRIDAVLLQALAKKPKERFASVLAFAQALQQAGEKPHEGTREHDVAVPSCLQLVAVPVVLQKGQGLLDSSMSQEDAEAQTELDVQSIAAISATIPAYLTCRSQQETVTPSFLPPPSEGTIVRKSLHPDCYVECKPDGGMVIRLLPRTTEK